MEQIGKIPTGLLRNYVDQWRQHIFRKIANIPLISYVQQDDDSLTTISLQVSHPGKSTVFTRKQLWDIYEALRRDMSQFFPNENERFLASRICEICRPSKPDGHQQALLKISLDAESLLRSMYGSDYGARTLDYNSIRTDDLYQEDNILLRKLEMLVYHYDYWNNQNGAGLAQRYSYRRSASEGGFPGDRNFSYYNQYTDQWERPSSSAVYPGGGREYGGYRGSYGGYSGDRWWDNGGGRGTYYNRRRRSLLY